VSEQSHELRAAAARASAWLPHLRRQRDEAEHRLGQLNSLLMEEKEAIQALCDRADILDGKETRKVRQVTDAPSATKPVEPGEKTCPTCKEPKRRERDFHRNRASHDGVASECKSCSSERGKAKRGRRKLQTAS
jgi:hypothetical protein